MTQSGIQRELFLTPEVKWFLEKCGKTQNAALLVRDISDALSGVDRRDSFIRLSSAPTFLLFIADPIAPGKPERVVVWSGPDDGRLYSESIFERAIPSGIEFQ